jgi:CRP/FNR family transcriptional regulator, dissimilatory nitrate respiration regulator
LAAFKHNPLFRELEDSDLELLLQAGRLLEVEKGTTIFLKGDEVEVLHLVLRGLVKVYRPEAAGGRQLVVRLEGVGRVVEVGALFADAPHYLFSAEALEPTQFLAIPAEVFLQLLERKPKAARAIIRYLVRQQNHLLGLLDRMVFQAIEARLAGYLLEQLELHGQGFQLPSNPELAAILGSVPEPVSRKLGQLYRQGFIDLKRRQVWILNLEGLRELAQR